MAGDFPKSATPNRQMDGLKGIGGWLLLFVVGQVISLVFNVMSALDVSGFSGDAWAVGEHVAIYRPLLVVEEICTILLCIGGVVGLVLIHRRNPQTPRFYVDYLAFVAGFGLLEFGGMAVLYPRLIAFIEASGGDAGALTQEQSGTLGLRQMLYGLLWLMYWRKSQRVANTFAPATSPGTGFASGPPSTS